MIQILVPSIGKAVVGSSQFRAGTDNICWISADMDAAGAELAKAVNGIIERLTAAEQFCHESLRRIEAAQNDGKQ